MVVYFVATRVTGIIGVLTSILSALYTFAIGHILNFIIQRTRGSDLRIRIATRGGSVTLVREYWVAGRRMWGGRHTILLAVLVLTFSGNAVPFIVNTGIKAGMGMVPQGSLRTWATSPYLHKDGGILFRSRQNSSDFLAMFFNDKRNVLYDKDFYYKYPRVDYKVLSEVKTVPIGSVGVHCKGANLPDHPVPGRISLTRNCTPSPRTLRAAKQRPPIGNSTTIVNLASATGMANSNWDFFISERPTTLIAGYTEGDGQSVLAAFTTTSFSRRMKSDSVWKLSQDGLIGSWNKLYSPIWDALNASAFSLPMASTTASSKATLVYNTASADSDNSTHITCVGCEANTSLDDQQQNRASPVVNMVSCRELHIAVMSSTGATLNPEPVWDYSMFRIYNAMAPNQVSPEDIDWKSGENITAVAQEVTEFLHNISERLYPFTPSYLAQVQVYDLKEGISFELRSLVFIGVMIGIVVLMYGLDWWWVDEVNKTDVLTLIETTTLSGVAEKPASTATMTEKEKKTEQKKRWSKRKYPKWPLETEAEDHHALLRGERVLVEQPEERQRLKTRGFA